MVEFFLGFVFAWSVIDGDTVRVSVQIWPNHAAVDERVRLVRVDAPEMHAPTACEKDLAAKATAYTRQRLAGAKKIGVRVGLGASRDSFGRILGDVIVDGSSLSDELLAQALARPYGTKGAWC
jgi:micrococcal nuclease